MPYELDVKRNKLDRIIAEILEITEDAMKADDIEVKEQRQRIPDSELFIRCSKCRKSTLNGGDMLCAACRTLRNIHVICGIPERKP